MSNKPIEAFHPKVLLRDWGAELIVAETPTYLGKCLTMNPGTKGGLQFHRDKTETFFLYEGRALVRSDDGTGHLQTVMMLPGQSYHIPAGAVHQVEAIERCVFFETSTPHYDDRVRVEAEYGLPEGGGLPTTR
jgi:mannose-6-phosphate isomerase-like protein (cupin superfamily)